MDSRDRKRVEELYQQAMDIEPDERAAFLDRTCEDTRLRAAVTALLDHYNAARAAFPDDLHSATADFPASIRHFVIEKPLGEGGMGTVYLARQQKPIARHVALKVIKPGMDSQQVLARFRAEQRALAILDHPGIARVYEAGTTADGRPYFAMEYVAGVPITRYCDEQRLTPRARIDLFCGVCAAIQFAHQKGIIHRDIKPGNVLVVDSDGGPVAKVIDFGVAKATQSDLIASETFTQQGQLVGTPEYMSPEQTEMNDIDTRTDVYTLGLLLYELLVGTPPFTSAQLRERGYLAMLHLIREEDPPRPSTRVSSLGESATDTALARRTQPRSLSRYLRGDLDWIVMKALEKNRERRYESVSSLVTDLQRHLQNEPVSARPPDALYRLRKFVRRHRTGVGVGTVAILALATVTAISVVQSRRVAAESERAHREAEISREVAQYLGNMFHEASVVGGGVEARLLDTVESGANGLSGERTPALSGEAQVRIMQILGGAFLSLGQGTRARETLQRSVSLAEFVHGPGSLEAAQSRYQLCTAWEEAGRFAEAMAGLEQVLPVFDRELGPRHHRTRECRWTLARLYRRLERNDEALAIYDALLADGETTGELAGGRLALYYNDVGIAYGNKFAYAKGAELCRKSLAVMEAEYGADHVNTVLPLLPLAEIAIATGDLAEARRLIARLERTVASGLGADHTQMAGVLELTGRLELETGNFDAAYDAYREAVDRTAQSPPNTQAIFALIGLARTERQLSRLPEARAHLEQGLHLLRERFPETDPRILSALLLASDIERASGRIAAADSLLEQVLVAGENHLLANDPVLMSARLHKGRRLTATGDYAGAENLLSLSYREAVGVYGAHSSRLEKVRSALNDLYAAWDRTPPDWYTPAETE